MIGEKPRVRWALHQRLGLVPTSLGKGVKGPTGTVDWFSGVAESIDVVEEEDKAEEDVDMEEGKKAGDGVLARMKRERAFGMSFFVLDQLSLSSSLANANVVVVPPPIVNDKNPQAKPPTLDELLFVHPSRSGGKSAWKERRKPKSASDRRIGMSILFCVRLELTSVQSRTPVTILPSRLPLRRRTTRPLRPTDSGTTRPGKPGWARPLFIHG